MKQEPFVSLSSLESDLRSRLEGEVRELEARRARLERDARAADEFVRRVGSMMPGSSTAALALYPSIANGRAARPKGLAAVAAALAVAMSFAALFLSTGHRAEIATASAAEPAPARSPRATACTDAGTVGGAGAVGGVGAVGVAEGAGAGAASIASSASPPPLPATPSRAASFKAAGVGPRARAATDAVSKAAPAVAAAAPATEAALKLEEAARTAALLREQLASALH